MTDVATTGTKPWQSKTIILNALGGLLAASALFWPNSVFVSAWLTNNAATVAMVWSFANVVLRFLTKDKITLGD